MNINEWPIYFADNLILGSKKSSVGVATLWTPKEVYEKKLNPDTYQVMGQLYSNDGINPMLRNVLSNPTIRTIVMCGQDKIGSADALACLINNGINEKGEVIGKEEIRVEKEIPHEAVEKFRKNVELVDMHGALRSEQIQEVLDKCEQNIEPWAEPELFPEPEISSEWYPSEGSTYTYRGKTVADVWPKMLHAIMRFGEEKMTNHSLKTQRELLNLISVVTDEDPDNVAWADYFPFTQEHYEGYKPQIMTGDRVPSLSYTYGSRLRDNNGVNQIQAIVKKLKEQDWSRQAVGVLWNVETDNDSSHPPCLNIVQALVKYNQLHFTCYLRSNDIFRAWPENALAFRTMQKEIADALKLDLGTLTTISGSGHIYEENYVAVEEIVEEHYPKLPCEQDPRGNYVYRIKDGKEIEVVHMSPEGRKIAVYTGTKAMDLFNEIAGNEGVSVFIHAMDIGAELQKAEIALKLGIEYTQDQPLLFKDLDSLSDK